jgi:GntR family transcriptional regulator
MLVSPRDLESRQRAEDSGAALANQLGSTSSLSGQLTEKLKSRLREGQWGAGDRLPSENELSEEYGVSRVTVRTSLKQLEAAGFVEIRHGAGTFVTPFGNELRSSLHELRSLTETIQDLGHVPSMAYRSRTFVPLPIEAAEHLLRAPASASIYLQRAVYSDATIVAVSHDWLPVDILPPEVTADAITGSTFAFLASVGLRPEQSIAEIHAADASDIDWGAAPPSSGLCVLLKQTHYARRGRPVMFSTTYFLEGRFQFVIRRNR